MTVTVKTVGAGFQVDIDTSTPLSSGIEIIPDWNGSNGYGYDIFPYSGTLSPVGANQIIATQT